MLWYLHGPRFDLRRSLRRQAREFMRQLERREMKAGLIYEIESVKPHAADHEYRVFWETMEQIELADKLGFDSVWTVEHHFLNEFSYCSAPEVFLACVAQRTKQIRIGHGVVVLPFSHPIHVAERIAVLDIMSNGRVEFGTGRATTMDELLGFGVRPEDTRPRWAEAVEAIPRMWREDPFTMHGKYWTDRAAGVGDSQADSETASADLGCGDESDDVRAGGVSAGSACCVSRSASSCRRCRSGFNLYRAAIKNRAASRADDKQPGLDEHHGADRRGPVRGRASRARGRAVVRAQGFRAGVERGGGEQDRRVVQVSEDRGEIRSGEVYR